jgi:hypothetical protein
MTKSRLKKLLMLSICAIFLTSGVNAKLLSKIKNNIKNTVNRAVKQTKDTFDKIVNKSKKNTGKHEHSKEAFFKALANPDDANVKGLDIYERNFEKKCEEYDKFLADLIWINQTPLITQLEQARVESKDKARLLLHDKILAKYPKSKAPAITFAADLNKEWEFVCKSIEELSDFNQKIKAFRDAENKDILEKLLKEFINLDLDSKKFSEIVCDLLV